MRRQTEEVLMVTSSRPYLIHKKRIVCYYLSCERVPAFPYRALHMHCLLGNGVQKFVAVESLGVVLTILRETTGSHTNR